MRRQNSDELSPVSTKNLRRSYLILSFLLFVDGSDASIHITCDEPALIHDPISSLVSLHGIRQHSFLNENVVCYDSCAVQVIRPLHSYETNRIFSARSEEH